MVASVYKLSEEICLQCLRVSFRTADWTEWFVNPTAGPWKKINIIGIDEDELLRFQKDEQRIDYITINSDKDLILVLEAKNDVNKLTNKNIEKSVSVFKSILDRLDKIYEKYKGTSLKDMSKEYKVIFGYLFPLIIGEKENYEELHQINDKHIEEHEKTGDDRLKSVVFLTISQKKNLKLIIQYFLNSSSNEIKEKKRVFLPDSIEYVSTL